MKIAMIILSTAVVALLIAVIWRSKKAKIKSFWDVVRNPSSMPDLGKFHKHVDDSASAISGSEEEIARLVDYFVFEAKSAEDAWTEQRILARLGEEAYPRALQILKDQSTHGRLLTLAGDKNSLPVAPICRLCKIFNLDTPPPPEAGDLLAPFLQSESPEIRKSVALIIGSVASSRSLPDLQRALKDEDDYVRSDALKGIQEAISDGRISQSSRTQFYEMVVGMWPQDTSFDVCNHIPKTLLRLDFDRAVKRLLEPDLFTSKFEPVWQILEAFSEESVSVPRPRLLTLIDEASTEPIGYPKDYSLGEALSLLGRHRSEEDIPILERMVDHPNKEVSRGAINGLYAHHQFFDVVRSPWDVVEADGWDALTVPEKHACAIEQLDAEVNNGGFAQYYFNSAGDRWRDALEGLGAIGATKRREIMTATIERFGRREPSPDRDARDSQLSKVVRKMEDPFNEQDTAWYETEDEPLERLLFRYNIANMKGRQKAT